MFHCHIVKCLQQRVSHCPDHLIRESRSTVSAFFSPNIVCHQQVHTGHCLKYRPIVPGFGTLIRWA
ncbi:uncharacterized protein BO88DRAFT_36037 [Aspergillus vadensis CBS 113365]|uniref:Uncharacterized protein n=1 Tax=Aspergillus vadensis (strain CBS 113365 / IMI 142717 / IBT 24658) TaxID=1448311 RepID=A0A319B9G5_ASPVC|nr:hypothetical protein BO88DRAFT_36037 [Aspergillus vadensis CBS 113365]PYH69556.1 hypothetical protein BO88DRAFT_36037 [Aspergillus vadensis CBS 113365]